MGIIIKLDKKKFVKKMWENAESRNLKKYGEQVALAETEGIANDLIDELAAETCKRALFYSIKIHGPLYEEPTSKELIDVELREMHLAMQMLSLTTPRQFMQIFPIAKEFKGEKTGVKDYFSTMEYIDSIGMDNLIEEPEHFLFEYHNWEIFDFMMNFTDLISDKYEEANGVSIFEQFCLDNDIPMYEMSNWPNVEGK